MPLKIVGDISKIINIASELQKYGTQKNIVSVFDDGGYRELLLATLFNLTLHKGRHGDDAADEMSNNYELKTVNLVDTSGRLRKNPGITTCHHVNFEILKRYREVHAWIVGIFFINEPVEIYEIPSAKLSDYFDKWDDRLKNESISHINNPKISFKDIRKKGVIHYENRDLVEKYIKGSKGRGIEVYQDIVDFDRTRVSISGDKIVATTDED